jgi:hypothetical protein
MARRVTSNENLTGSSVALRKNLDMETLAGSSDNYVDWIVLADREKRVFNSRFFGCKRGGAAAACIRRQEN